jgi:hypothetical protein
VGGSLNNNFAISCFRKDRRTADGTDGCRASSGSRISDYVSLGVISKTFPFARVLTILKAAEKSSVRQRDLPAHVVVYM